MPADEGAQPIGSLEEALVAELRALGLTAVAGKVPTQWKTLPPAAERILVGHVKRPPLTLVRLAAAIGAMHARGGLSFPPAAR